MIQLRLSPIVCYLVWSACSSFVAANQGNLCMLCADGLGSLHYPDAVIQSDGTTCTGMAIGMAQRYEKGTEQCDLHIQAWRQICCGDDEPVDVDITDVLDQEDPDGSDVAVTGEYKKCELCRNGNYPGSDVRFAMLPFAIATD